jgi:hypothetical protein
MRGGDAMGCSLLDQILFNCPHGLLFRTASFAFQQERTKYFYLSKEAQRQPIAKVRHSRDIAPSLQR